MGRSAIIGTHFYFLPEGITVDTLTVGSTVKPDHEPATNWTDYKVTAIEKTDIENDISTVSIRTPIDDVGSGVPGGVYQAKDELAQQQNIQIILTCAEINQTVWEAIWLATVVQASTGVYTPLAASGLKKGWARLAQYDHANTLVNTVEFWCTLSLNGQVSFSEDDVTRTQLRLKVLQNTLNSGNLVSFF